MLRTGRRFPLGIAALVVAGCCLAAACGKKGDPLPPIRLLPAATTDLAAAVRGEEILLELPYPTTTAAGTPLPGVSEVAVWQLVWRAPESAEPALPTADERRFAVAAEPAAILTGPDVGAAVRGDRLVVRLPRPPAPEGEGGRPIITVAVKTQGPGGEESAFSNRVDLPWTEPPPPPTGLELEAVARGVRVRWEHGSPAGPDGPEDDAAADEAEAEAEDEAEAGAAAGDGSGLAGFAVYRRLATERAYGDPLRLVPASRRVFLDESAIFGQRYVYAVTALARRRPRVESALGEEVEIAYRDRFAPGPPTGVVALAEPGRVRLVWEASPAPDLAGYRVYRRGPEAQEFVPLGEDLVTATERVDATVVSGASYSYRVTALDALGNESEPSATVAAQVP